MSDSKVRAKKRITFSRLSKVFKRGDTTGENVSTFTSRTSTRSRSDSIENELEEADYTLENILQMAKRASSIETNTRGAWKHMTLQLTKEEIEGYLEKSNYNPIGPPNGRSGSAILPSSNSSSSNSAGNRSLPDVTKSKSTDSITKTSRNKHNSENVEKNSNNINNDHKSNNIDNNNTYFPKTRSPLARSANLNVVNNVVPIKGEQDKHTTAKAIYESNVHAYSKSRTVSTPQIAQRAKFAKNNTSTSSLIQQSCDTSCSDRSDTDTTDSKVPHAEARKQKRLARSMKVKHDNNYHLKEEEVRDYDEDDNSDFSYQGSGIEDNDEDDNTSNRKTSFTSISHSKSFNKLFNFSTPPRQKMFRTSSMPYACVINKEVVSPGEERRTKRSGKKKKRSVSGNSYNQISLNHSVDISSVLHKPAAKLPFASVKDEDIMSLVFAYISLKDAARVALTCKHWKKLAWKMRTAIDFSNLYMPPHTFNSINYQSNPSLVHQFSLRNRAHRRAHVNNPTLKKKQAIMELKKQAVLSSIRAIPAWCEHLQQLKLPQHTSNKEIQLICEVEQLSFTLQVLDLSKDLHNWQKESYSIEITNKSMKSIEKLTSLTALHLENCFQITEITEITRLTNLQVLNLCNLRISAESLNAICALPHLRYLDLSGCTNIVEESLVYLKKLTRLEHLQLGKPTEHREEQHKFWAPVYNISDHSLIHLHSLTTLRSLTIRGCMGIGGHSLRYISHLTNLTALEWSECKAFTPSNSNPLKHLQSLKCLSSLSLRSCSFVTNEELARLVNLPALTHLDLFDCKQFTDDGLYHLGKLSTLQWLFIGSDNGRIYNVTIEGLQQLSNILPPGWRTLVTEGPGSDQDTDISFTEDDGW